MGKLDKIIGTILGILIGLFTGLAGAAIMRYYFRECPLCEKTIKYKSSTCEHCGVGLEWY